MRPTLQKNTGIEAIWFGSDVPNPIRAYVKHNLVRLRLVFEITTKEIPLLIKRDPVKLCFKPNAVSQ